MIIKKITKVNPTLALVARQVYQKKAWFAEQIQRCHIILLIPAKYKKYTSGTKFKCKCSKSVL